MRKYFTVTATIVLLSTVIVQPVSNVYAQTDELVQTTETTLLQYPTQTLTQEQTMQFQTNQILVSAEDLQVTEQVVVQSAQTVIEPPNIPGTLGLFFRDISQRIQLIFTFEAVADATLRLKFAEENVQLVRYLTALSATSGTIAQANQLTERAHEFLRTVNEREADWSRADPQALEVLLAQADNYFKATINLLLEISNMSGDDAWRQTLLPVFETLLVETQKTKLFLQTNIRQGLLSSVSGIDSSTVISPADDKDADGLEDKDEIVLGLSTSDYDTDGDGLSDRTELERFGTDPTKADTDGDGYRDGLEVLKGFNPVGGGNFSTSTLKKDGFVFVKAKLTLPTLSTTTLKLLQDAALGQKLERYQGN